MAEASSFLTKTRYAVVTGSNKGIGLEICRQLASQGVVVVLTARNESRGREALENLKKSGIPSDNLEFHQLDVTDPSSIASLVDFISAKFGKLDILYIRSQRVRGILGNVDSLTEERIDEVLNEFLRDFKEGSLEMKGWRSFLPPYSVSKAALNAYTRILAKKYPSIIINCLCPGYVKTDIIGNCGTFTVEEGGSSCARLALLPHGSPSGLFYRRNEVSSF